MNIQAHLTGVRRRPNGGSEVREGWGHHPFPPWPIQAHADMTDLDRFEMACQGMIYSCITDIQLRLLALEYERRHEGKDLQSFFDSSLPFIRHHEVQAWGHDLLNERNAGSGSMADSSLDTTTV